MKLRVKVMLWHNTYNNYYLLCIACCCRIWVKLWTVISFSRLVLRLHFKLHIHTRQYYVIFLNWQFCMLLSYVFALALAGRTNLQSLLLYITFIVARHTYWPLYYYYHVQPSSAAFSTDICYFCLRWSEVMSIVDVMPDAWWGKKHHLDFIPTREQRVL